MPISFDISFTYHDVKYRYALSFVVGKFLNKGAERYINHEQLYVNDTLIFEHTKDSVSELSLASIKDSLNVGYNMGDTQKHRVSMGSNMNTTNLLLVTDFYSFCSKAIVTEIKDWFTKQFMVVNSSDRMRFYPNMAEIGR